MKASALFVGLFFLLAADAASACPAQCIQDRYGCRCPPIRHCPPGCYFQPPLDRCFCPPHGGTGGGPGSGGGIPSYCYSGKKGFGCPGIKQSQ
jgi:hypothetical protein